MDNLSHLLCVLRDRLPRALTQLHLQPDGLVAWKSHLDRKLIPLAQHLQDGLVTVAIAGAANVGKSTLFNTLLNMPDASTVNFRAGTTQEVIAALHPKAAKVFDGNIAPLLTREGQTGQVRRIMVETLPEQIILLDTPDFNTGAGSHYANRAATSAALDASDVFIYLVTNTTYADRDNHDFIRDKLARIGLRKSFLLYSDPAATTPTDALDEITASIAERIYGHEWPRYVLGRYKVPRLRDRLLEPPLLIGNGMTQLSEQLHQLQAVDVHADYLRSALHDVEVQGRSMLAQAHQALRSIERYREASEMGLTRVVECADDPLIRALSLRRLLQHFERLAPPWVQVANQVGSVLAWPMDKLIQLFQSRDAADAELSQCLSEVAERVCAESLRLRNGLQSDSLEGVPQPAVLSTSRDGLAARDWPQVAERIRIETRRSIFVLSDEPQTPEEHELDVRLSAAANRVRDMMSTWEATKEATFAVLRVLPAPVALAYVLLTGDIVVGAPTIWGKLQGLFSAPDLLALALPIPAKVINEAIDLHTRAQIEASLNSYREFCLRQLRTLIRKELLADFVHAIERIQTEVTPHLEEAAGTLDVLTRELP